MATNNENINECYICLDNINLNENDFLELNCCKNNVHLKCLIEWYIKNNTSNCFICNQTNDFCKELVHNSKIVNDIHYIQIQPIQPNQSNQSNQPNQPNQSNLIIYTKNKLLALIICYIVNFFILINLIIILYN